MEVTDISPSLDTVYQAVYMLFLSPNTSEKDKAAKFLGNVQKSVHAWKIADNLLHQKVSMECCYFAAQTMRSKVQLSFNELPISCHSSLRDSLMEHIASITPETNQAIMVQLCLAITDFALQMSNWEKPVPDLISRFHSSNVLALLEILRVFPEEFTSGCIKLSPSRRGHILDHFASSVSLVFEYWHYCMTNFEDNEVIKSKILQCYSSWVSTHAVNLEQATNNHIITLVFSILRDPKGPLELHEYAADCICALLQCIESDTHHSEQVDKELFFNVIELQKYFFLAVAIEAEVKILNYARIFIELAEIYMDKIISRSELSSHSLDLILLCVGHYDCEVAAITFNFWHRLADILGNRQDLELVAYLKPYIERLINGLSRHCELDSDSEGLLDNSDDFNDFRKEAFEIIHNLSFSIGSITVFQQMFLTLHTPNIQWEKVEAALFVMQAVAKNISPEENDVVPKVLEAILNLSFDSTHVAVQHTAILLLGELSFWMNRHPQVIDPVLNFLISRLSSPTVANAAADSLLSVCHEARSHLIPYVSKILPVICTLDFSPVTHESVTGCLKGMISIANVMPHEEIPKVLDEICRVQIQGLNAANDGYGPGKKGTKLDPCLWLDRISAIFKHARPTHLKSTLNHPCVSASLQCWPTLSKTFVKFQTDAQIMEKCCRCIRYILRCTAKYSSVFVDPLISLLEDSYPRHQHSCFLYVGSVIVDEFANSKNFSERLISMFHAFAPCIFNRLQTEHDIIHHPDSVDDFFRLCHRFILRLPLPFLTFSGIYHIVELAITAIKLNHKEANTSVLKFICDLFTSGSSSDPSDDNLKKQKLVNAIVEKYGLKLIKTLIEAAVFILPAYMINNVSDVICHLFFCYNDAARHWLQEVFKEFQTHNSNGLEIISQSKLSSSYDTIVMSADYGVKPVTHALKALARYYR